MLKQNIQSQRKAMNEIIWLAWPYDDQAKHLFTTQDYYDETKVQFLTLIRTILKYNDVNLICISEQEIPKIKQSLGKTLHQINYIADIPIDDNWMRDISPIFRVDPFGNMDCFSFQFNGWGGKQKYSYDSNVAERIAKYLNIKHQKSFLFGEGGGVITDGDGTLIANQSSWVNENRNPNLSRAEIQKQLLRLYGAKKMIWCPGVKDFDITDCHIDCEVSFIAPGKIFITKPDQNCQHPISKSSRLTYQILRNETDAHGRKFDITLMDQATSTRIQLQSECEVKSYLNYLVLDGAVINVEFGCEKSDLQAKQKLEAAYPGKIIEMINMDYTYGSYEGGIHCLSQEQPVPQQNIDKKYPTASKSD